MVCWPSLRKGIHTSLSYVQSPPLYRRVHISNALTETDSCGLPTAPTWSVNQLLSSYPTPNLPVNTIARLYELSALGCPKEDTPKFKHVKEELEYMIRLVQAVRLVDTCGIPVKGRGEKEDSDMIMNQPEPGDGRKLLKHTSQSSDGYYIVDSERRR